MQSSTELGTNNEREHEVKEEIEDDDPVLNPEPPTKMEEEMDKMFDSNNYPALDEIIGAAIPKEGDCFKTRQDAFYSYALYARKTGFSVKKSSSKRSRRGGDIYMQTFECNKEGISNTQADPTRKRKTNTLVKCECRAHIIVKEFEKGWFIKKVELEHNHPLEPTDYLIRFAHCHKRMTDLDRRLIQLLQRGRLPPRKMMLIFRSLRCRYRGIDRKSVV